MWQITCGTRSWYCRPPTRNWTSRNRPYSTYCQLDHLSVHLSDVVHFCISTGTVDTNKELDIEKQALQYNCHLDHLSVHRSGVAHFCISTGTVDTNKELGTKKRDAEYALLVRSPLSPSVQCSPLQFCISTGTVDTSKELDTKKQALQYVLPDRSLLSPSLLCCPLLYQYWYSWHQQGTGHKETGCRVCAIS